MTAPAWLYAEVLADQTRPTVIGFLQRAVAFYAHHGITVERVLTDNGGAYRSAQHAVACRQLGIRHLHTRAYRPQTNGRAERYIRILTEGWTHRRSTAPAPKPPRLTDGSFITTITANTQLSATNRPSLAFTSGTNLHRTYT